MNERIERVERRLLHRRFWHGRDHCAIFPVGLFAFLVRARSANVSVFKKNSMWWDFSRTLEQFNRRAMAAEGKAASAPYAAPKPLAPKLSHFQNREMCWEVAMRLIDHETANILMLAGRRDEQ